MGLGDILDLLMSAGLHLVRMGNGGASPVKACCGFAKKSRGSWKLRGMESHRQPIEPENRVRRCRDLAHRARAGCGAGASLSAAHRVHLVFPPDLAFIWHN